MPLMERSLPARVLVALALVVVAALVRNLFDFWIDGQAAFLLFALAILSASILAGPLAAAIAVFPSLLLGIYFSGFRETGAVDFVEAALFLLTAAVSSCSHARATG